MIWNCNEVVKWTLTKPSIRWYVRPSDTKARPWHAVCDRQHTSSWKQQVILVELEKEDKTMNKLWRKILTSKRQCSGPQCRYEHSLRLALPHCKMNLELCELCLSGILRWKTENLKGLLTLPAERSTSSTLPAVTMRQLRRTCWTENPQRHDER